MNDPDFRAMCLTLRRWSDERIAELAQPDDKRECGFTIEPWVGAQAGDQDRWDVFLETVKNLFDQDNVVKVSSELKRITFDTGDRPFLPFNGHAFALFKSTTQLQLTRNAEYYIRMIFQIAERQFKSRVRLWHDVLDSNPRAMWCLGGYFMDTSTAAEISRLTSRSTIEAAPLSEYYAIRSVPHKGLGLLAARSISKGSRILFEEPLFLMTWSWTSNDQVSRVVSAKLRQLPKEQQRLFFSLNNSFPTTSTALWGIANTNAIPIEEIPIDPTSTPTELPRVAPIKVGIFVQACRINHSCVANCFWSWSEKRQALTVHALRDIEPGEEITVNYLPRTLPIEQRYFGLAKKFAFLCQCENCTSSDEACLRRDERVVRAARLEIMAADTQHLAKHPHQHLQQLRELVHIYLEQKVSDTRLALAYEMAYETVLAHGDRARAGVFAQGRYEALRTCLGEDNERTIAAEESTRKLTLQDTYGVKTQRWARSEKAIPKSLVADSKEFGKWLWKSEDRVRATRKKK